VNLVAPFGFYGWGNTGDEATLQGFARLLSTRQPVPSVWIASKDPAHTARVEPAFHYFRADGKGPRARWAHLRAKALVVPGGTPIMDALGTWPLDVVGPMVRSAFEAGKAIAFVGSGTETLHRPESRAVVAEDLGPRVSCWTVRSPRDRDRLVGWGVPSDRVVVAADLAWLLPPAAETFGRRALADAGLSPDAPVIGVNVNNEAVILEREPAFFDTMAGFLDTAIERHGVQVLFFCSETRRDSAFDHAAGLRVLAAMQHRGQARMLPPRYHAPQELMSLASCFRLTVSTRYHVCLFSALQRVPFIALQRSDKVLDLCLDIDWPHGLPLGSIRADALLDCAAAIDRHYAELQTHLQDAGVRQTRASLRNHASLDALAGRVREVSAS